MLSHAGFRSFEFGLPPGRARHGLTQDLLDVGCRGDGWNGLVANSEKTSCRFPTSRTEVKEAIRPHIQIGHVERLTVDKIDGGSLIGGSPGAGKNHPNPSV